MASLFQLKTPLFQFKLYLHVKMYIFAERAIMPSKFKTLLTAERNLPIYPGSANDVFIWSQSGVQTFLSQNPQSGYLQGDQAP